MSLELYVAIDNAEDRLQAVLPAYAVGQLPQPKVPHGLAILFRQRGTCKMLVEGQAEPLFTSMMQTASLYAHALGSLPDEERVTSLAACFWDAVAGGYEDAAREIARHSRPTHNAAREHEDDFLYVMYLMQRYWLAPPASDDEATHAHAQAQEARLARWEEVLEGGSDPRLDLCRALEPCDEQAVQDALEAMAEQRASMLEAKLAKGALEPEHMLWARPVWPEGLALLRLFEREGFGDELTCPGAPPLLRAAPPFRYARDAWRTVDFVPVRR